eukprot:SAG31_NODE_33304_length_345_cov_1.012195_1_plen_56_part_01
MHGRTSACADSTELDFAHCLDVRNSVFWLTSPSKNYSESGLFDLVGVDLLQVHILC